MQRLPFHLPISAGVALALIVCFAPVAPAQTTGYWQYVKTEAYTNKLTNGAYAEKSTGTEGAFTLVTRPTTHRLPRRRWGAHSGGANRRPSSFPER
jgi:hypothetical protein